MPALTVHSWGMNDLLLPEVLGTLARLGFRYVDLGTGGHLNVAHATSPSKRAAHLQEIRGDLAMFNLQVVDVYVMLPRISAADEAKRETDLKIFKALVPFVKAIGARGITVSAGSAHPPDDSEAHARAVDGLQQMLAAARKAELPLSIEPHLDSMAATPAQALAFVEAVDGLQVTLDWAHLACQKHKPAEIAKLLPHTRHLHLRGYAPNRLQVPFEKSKHDLAEIVALVRESGYTGMVCLDFMQTLNWHGAQAVDIIRELLRWREALRALWT